jgi:hypothetical protein
MNMALFEMIDRFAGNNHMIDVGAMVMAEYLPYVMGDSGR